MKHWTNDAVFYGGLILLAIFTIAQVPRIITPSAPHHTSVLGNGWIKPELPPMPEVSPRPVDVFPKWTAPKWTCATAESRNAQLEDQALQLVIAYPSSTFDPLFGQTTRVMDAGECAARRWRLEAR